MNPDQFIHDRVRIAGRYILPSVRQLIFITEHGEPEPVGSCALLWHRARRCLVSAAHVLDVFRSHPLSIGTASSWHTLEGEFRATNVPATGKREDDAYDYAFMLLSDRDASALDGCHFLTADQVASGETPIFNGQTRSKYLAIGWPRNR